MSRKTTLIQVAEAAGVSLSTVDRVLNRRGGVSAAAEERVLEWAGRLNIDRVAFRQYLKVLRIAVVMQTPRNPFYKGLQDAFADLNKAMLDLKISCFIHYIDVTDVIRTINKINQISAAHDALIIVSPDDPRLSDALKVISGRIPIVTLVTDLPNSGRIAYIGPDNRQTGRVAGELMGRFLGPNGGEVLVVLGMHRIVGHEEREMGFRSVLKGALSRLHDRRVARKRRGPRARRRGRLRSPQGQPLRPRRLQHIRRQHGDRPVDPNSRARGEDRSDHA